MLKSLRTKNFRKLEDNFFEFESGMVVIRGENEAGKSTFLEAIAYALFGVKSCRGSLADVVTWGQPENTLAVELVMVSEGIDYTIKRSKAGAEINYEGGKVTGQTECSNFVENLFGVNNGNVGKLVSSSQGDIRGALAQGPKATMELIESLANFQLLDDVIELVQANLLTGPTASAEAVLQSADLRLQLEQAKVIEPETDSWEARAVVFENDAAVYLSKAEAAKPVMEETARMLSTANHEAAAVEKLNASIEMYTGAIDSRKASMAALVETIALRPDTETIANAEKAYADAVNADALVKEHAAMVRLMSTYPEDVWEGSEFSLDEEISKTANLITDIKAGIASQQADIRLFSSQKVTGSVCGFCNQDVSKFPEIAKKNADLDESIKLAEEAISSLQATQADEEGTQRILVGIKKLQSSFKSLESENVLANTLQVPVSLSWVGQVPKPVDAAYIQQKKSELESLKVAGTLATNAEAKLISEKELIAEYTKKREEAKVNVMSFPLAGHVEITQANYDKAKLDYDTLAGKAGDSRVEAEAIREAIAFELAAFENMKNAVAEAELDVAVAKKAVDELTFNNALIKRLRAARPLIADKLWNVVLAAVSSYFSNMRGVVSVVTKAPDGFKVDGHSVEGLSGSTLDILGLAIRLALTRTFLPSAPFLILDEPSAACSDSRTQQMTGFLLAFGFTQTLIVTHKDVDEGAANQLITI